MVVSDLLFYETNGGTSLKLSVLMFTVVHVHVTYGNKY